MSQAYDTISWREVRALIAGLLPETPLGKVIAIRSEKNRETLKHFTSEQRRMRSQWLARNANKQLENPEQLDKEFSNLEKTLQVMFG